MKLRELEIEHFGIFSAQTLVFDGGFSLVFGPNEAGKSTLLQLIRELLFGFKPLQNPYVFDDHGGELAATACFDVSDGTQLRFRRRKGKKNEVVGRLEPLGRDIDAGGLNALLRGAHKELYEQVFGFSLRELTQADESLKRANLTEALYGGGLGGLANFQRVQSQLQAEADGLFTPRGSKQQIHKLLAEIKSHAKALKEATVKPRDFEQLLREAKDADAIVQSQRQELDSLRSRQAHLERLADALGPWLRRCHAERELSQLSVPAEFPADGDERFLRLKARRTEITEELAAIELEMADEAEQLQSLRLAPEVLAHEAAIRELEQQITQVAGYRRDLPLRQQDSNSIKAQVLAQLRSFSPDWDATQLERFRTTLAQRETIDRLESKLEDLLRQQESTKGKRSTVEADLRAIQKQLDQIQRCDVPARLSALLDRASAYQRDIDRLAEFRDQLAGIDESIQSLFAKLNAPLRSSLDESVELQVPLASTVLEFRERWKQSENDVAEAEHRVKATRQELEQKQEQLEQLDARAAVPDREQLLAARQDRDSGWQFVRQQLVGAKKPSDEAIRVWLDEKGRAVGKNLTKTLADAFAESVVTADAVADERQEKSEQAAARDQLKHELNRLAKRLAASEQSLELQRQQHQLRIQEWEALWSACPFTPLSPDAMLAWLSVFDELTGARSQRRQLAARAAELQKSVAAFAAELAAVAPDASGETSQQLVLAKQLHEQHRDAAVRRHTYEQQLYQKQEALAALDKQLAALDEQDRDWQQRWKQLLDQFQFPRDWDVHIASKILGGLADARSQWDKAVDLDNRINDMTSGIAAFQTAVRSLCRDLLPELADVVPEHAMNELQSSLESAKLAARDDHRLRASRAKLQKRLAAKQEQLGKIEQEIDRLFAAAAVSSESDFERVASDARRRCELLGVSREAASEINAIRGTEPEASFTSELEQADADSLAAEQRHVAEKLGKVEADFNDAFRNATRLDDRHKELDGASRAAELALDLESTRSQLASAVDRWAPLVLAQALMKHSIKKFEREHQPAMLAEVERLLERMTLGRYQAIERKLDEQGTLLVVDRAGVRKEPGQLSTGTREQLYLAIRLAYIHHYCQDAEPLPIVMDDVLVNFDAQRARQTLQVFAEVADRVQIILMTCHQHMIDLVRDVLPTTQPIVLPAGKSADGALVASRDKHPAAVTTELP